MFLYVQAIEDQCKNIAKLKEHGHELVEDKLQPFLFKPEANSISATCTRPKQKSGWEWRNLNGERGVSCTLQVMCFYCYIIMLVYNEVDCTCMYASPDCNRISQTMEHGPC